MTTLIPKLTLAAGAVAIGLFASNASQAGTSNASPTFDQAQVTQIGHVGFKGRGFKHRGFYGHRFGHRGFYGSRLGHHRFGHRGFYGSRFGHHRFGHHGFYHRGFKHRGFKHRGFKGHFRFHGHHG